jgi:tRNA 2-thiouridine synthesizing protein A
MTETELDLAGLKCPLPALKTRKALERLSPGDRLRVISTDPLAGIDIPHVVRQSGDVLEGQHQSDGRFVFHIAKA